MPGQRNRKNSKASRLNGLPRTEPQILDANLLHHRWAADSHNRQQCNQFAAHDCCCRQEELLAALVGLVQDVVAVVEIIEFNCIRRWQRVWAATSCRHGRLHVAAILLKSGTHPTRKYATNTSAQRGKCRKQAITLTILHRPDCLCKGFIANRDGTAGSTLFCANLFHR